MSSDQSYDPNDDVEYESFSVVQKPLPLVPTCKVSLPIVFPISQYFPQSSQELSQSSLDTTSLGESVSVNSATTGLSQIISDVDKLIHMENLG